jgi:hypothetical protein
MQRFLSLHLHRLAIPRNAVRSFGHASVGHALTRSAQRTWSVLESRLSFGNSCYSTGRVQRNIDEDDKNDGDLRLEDDGAYNIVVPKDPYTRPVFPPPRPVPAHIVRPPYALDGGSSSWSGSTRPKRITLGTDEETKLRRAAKLARRVLNYGGTLVKVRDVSGSLQFHSAKWRSQV